MKFEFDGYEVEIKAKQKWNNRVNKEDTLCFMNSLAIYAREAANYYATEQLNALMEEANGFADTLYKICDAAGLYNKH